MSRVARYHADRTNQKLYFAKLALNQADMQSAATQRQIHQALREVVIFHLQGAVLALLQELARYYKVNHAAPTLAIIEENLAKRDQIAPEINELKALYAKGFLHELEQAWQTVQYAPTPAEPVYDELPDAHADNPLKMLDATQLANAPLSIADLLPDTVTLKAWYTQLKQFINAMREQQVEF